MMEWFAAGMYITEIAKKTHRNWRTVAKVVYAPEMTQYLKEEQEKMAQIVGPAREVVEEDIVKGRNADRAAWLMEAFGVVPNGRQPMVQVNTQVNAGQLNGQMSKEQFEAGCLDIAWQLAKGMMERGKAFDMPLEVPEFEGLNGRVKKEEEKG